MFYLLFLIYMLNIYQKNACGMKKVIYLEKANAHVGRHSELHHRPVLLALRHCLKRISVTDLNSTVRMTIWRRLRDYRLSGSLFTKSASPQPGLVNRFRLISVFQKSRPAVTVQIS